MKAFQHVLNASGSVLVPRLAKPARARTVRVCAAAKHKLTYFAIPGRAEVARLIFTVGGIAFEDNIVDFGSWQDMKVKMPFGQVPVLEADGQLIAQSAAIDHYAAKVAGLMPQDPVKAALADQAYFFVEDILQLLVPTFRMKDPAEQARARQELAAGPLKEKLTLLNKLVESRPGKYLSGDTLSHGDLAVFNHLSMLRSGLMAGMPTDILDGFPALKAFRNEVATVPAIAAYYAKSEDDTRKNGYRADA